MKINATEIRKAILEMVHGASSGHLGGSFSIADIISVLYSNFKLSTGVDDKLILSKGHAVPAVYAALYLCDKIKKEELKTFREINSRLQGHPDKVRFPNVVATTGSLGQGLSIAIGHAIGHKLRKVKDNVFCILGDGEMQEGQVWESIMLAPKFKLDNLCCFLDLNGAQNDGNVEDILSLNMGKDISEKILSFGWHVEIIDGHNEDAILKAIKKEIKGKSKFIIACTKKGKGVSFMETPEWHAKAPNIDQYEKAIKELNNESN